MVKRTKSSYVDKKYILNKMLNIVLNVEKLQAFPLRSAARQGYPFSLFFFRILLKVLNAIRTQRKEKIYGLGKICLCLHMT